MLGKDLVTQIRAMLDVETRLVRANLGDDMAEYAAKALGLGESDVGSFVFDTFRRNELAVARDRVQGEPLRDPDARIKERVVADLEQAMPGLQSEALRGFVENSMSRYLELRNELFAARSRAAHVGAVLRPFQRRYLDLWESFGLNGLDYAEVRASIEFLKNEEINSQVELQKWSLRVFELFETTAVIHKTEFNSPKPLGSIRASSLRTYKQQWNSWIKANEMPILHEGMNIALRAETWKLANQLRGEARANNLQTVEAPLAKSRPMPDYANLDFGAGNLSVSVSIADQSNSGYSAERTWANIDSARNKVAKWVSLVETQWSRQNGTLLITCKLRDASGESTMSLPCATLAEAAARLPEMLASLT